MAGARPIFRLNSTRRFRLPAAKNLQAYVGKEGRCRQESQKRLESQDKQNLTLSGGFLQIPMRIPEVEAQTRPTAVPAQAQLRDCTPALHQDRAAPIALGATSRQPWRPWPRCLCTI